ncbi:MAG TPA: hypothetical protein VNM36_10090 [Gemmatimonadaceae bacterium]|jgi:hypothetical protein|nr:hypothetical protein [Gemmatimonadaceae bacterium]
MQRDRAAGSALIAGSLAGLVTMAFHPTGHALTSDFARVAAINRTVHGLAIAATIATFFGLMRLSRQFENGKALSDAALVSYGFGAVAVMFAAIASGFIATDLKAIVLEAGGNAQAAYEPAFDFGWALNQASTKVFVLTASIGIALWSVAMLRDPTFGRGIGITGLLVGSAATIATLSGLQMDIHGFGAIVLGHGIWLIWTGIRLLRG